MLVYKHISPSPVHELSAKMVGKQRWYKTPEGNFYPSITTVLGIKEKPALIAWRKSLGASKADAETARAAYRGEMVHLMCEKALMNNPNPTEGQKLEHIKLFTQLKFALKRIDNIRIQEKPVFSNLFEVAGRVDVVAEYEGVLSVIDFKTSNNNKSDEMVEDYFIQETFYALAYREVYGEKINRIVTIMAVENGGLPMIWRKSITPYLYPLEQRVNAFYQSL